MKKRSVLALVVLILCSVTFPRSAVCESWLADSVHQFRLGNGMRWLLVPRRQAPVFSGVVMVRVGGADEPLGKAGIAHMLEHMAFKGSRILGTRDWKKEKPILEKISALGRELSLEKNQERSDQDKIQKLQEKIKKIKAEHEKYYLKNEIWELMSRNGGHDINAYTSKDVTAYHASMPINRLELWAAVLSQMVGDPVFREFYIERDVVAEERRTDIDNNPDGKLAETLLERAFQDSPYRWTTIGSGDEIQKYLKEDAEAFQKKHYVPELMVGVLVGDLEIDKTERIIRKYFGRIPRGKKPDGPKVGENVGGGRTAFTFDAQPSVVLAFHKPTLPDPEEYVFDVATSLLCDGPTSRLYRKLVIEDKIAQQVSCSDAFPGSRLPNLMVIWIEPMNGTEPDRIVAMVKEQLEMLKKKPAKEEELERVRKKVAAGFIYALETNMGLAEGLAKFETLFDNWRLLITYPEHVANVSSRDVMQLAKKYLTGGNLTVVMRVKK